MAYKQKTKKHYEVRTYTGGSYPVHVNTFDIPAKNEKEALKLANKRTYTDNPDKPKRYFKNIVM